jgi:hypothetical protein
VPEWPRSRLPFGIQPEPCQGHANAVHKRCTRDAHRTHQGCTRARLLCIRCASGVHLLCTACGWPWPGSARWRRPRGALGAPTRPVRRPPTAQVDGNGLAEPSELSGRPNRAGGHDRRSPSGAKSVPRRTPALTPGQPKPAQLNSSQPSTRSGIRRCEPPAPDRREDFPGSWAITMTLTTELSRSPVPLGTAKI